MKRKRKNSPLWKSILIASFFCSACSPDQSFDCLVSSGPLIEQEILTHEFNRVVISDDINVYLTQSPQQAIMLKTGKNLAPNIRFEVKDQTLVISNDNTCNWVRRYKQTKVFINSNQLKSIQHKGYGKIESLGQWQADSLEVYSEGTGDIRLALEVDYLKIDSHLLCNISCHGTAEHVEVNFHDDDGQFNGKELIANKIDISHHGSNIIEVFPLQELSGSIHRNGDVIYYNNPDKISVDVLQNGQLIDKSDS